MNRRGYSVRGLANWILDFADCEDIGLSNMALNKLVFFAVEVVLVQEKALLTNAKIEAWEHGPVFREVYQDFKRYGDKPITTRASFYSVAHGTIIESKVDLSDHDERVLRDILRPLIRRSAAELRRLSHTPGGVWERTWNYEGHANPGMEISPQAILEVATESLCRNSF